MTTFRTNAASSVALRHETRIATVVVCLLMAGIASGTEPIHPVATTAHGQRPPPTSNLIVQLTKLRDVTIKSFFPTQDVSTSPLNWDDPTATQFDATRQLFKPIEADSYSDTLKKTLNQQTGLQVGRNTQFQFDFQRYWTVEDRQEVSVKLGLHFDFR